MKLLSLNIWGGKVYEPLMSFIEKYSQDVDIFCFQEVFKSPLKGFVSNGTRVSIYDDIAGILRDCTPYFGLTQEGWDLDKQVDFEVQNGQATFVKKGVTVESYQHIFLYPDRSQIEVDNQATGAMLCTRVLKKGKTITVCNVHGLVYPGTKVDTDQRITQSEIIKNFISKEKGPAIVSGDFNLMPDTKSIAMLAEDMENLIKKFNIPSTRTSLSYYDNSPQAQKFADYTFVSPEIKVKNFKVPLDKVSDHFAMYLDFD